jgi:hypothetical protein
MNLSSLLMNAVNMKTQLVTRIRQAIIILNIVTVISVIKVITWMRYKRMIWLIVINFVLNEYFQLLVTSVGTIYQIQFYQKICTRSWILQEGRGIDINICRGNSKEGNRKDRSFMSLAYAVGKITRGKKKIN